MTGVQTCALPIWLKAGKTIYIPVKAIKKDGISNGDKSVDTIKCKPFDPSKETFHIALLLPFNFPSPYETDSLERFFDNPWSVNTISSLEFYEGIILALDSLKKHGLHLELHTFICPDDSAETAKMLDNPDLKKMNLIIGSIFNRYINRVANFAKTNKIPLLYPFANPALTENNPYVSAAVPCNNTDRKSVV